MLGQGAGGAIVALRACVLLASSLLVTFLEPVRAETTRDSSLSGHLSFDIPAQPLGAALDAYSMTTGLDVFYNAAIAERRHSNAAHGTFTPLRAIQIILGGSGYVAHVTAPWSLTIVPENTGARATQGLGRADVRFEPYFSLVQQQVDQILCDLPDEATGRTEVLLRMWLKPSGEVVRADVLADANGASRPLASVISQVRFVAPPADMPQPVTLVIFPPVSKADRQCLVAPRKDSSNDDVGKKSPRSAQQLEAVQQ
ncbi:hypothetical protein SAMN05216374_0395 [Tardiphaga sp. OK246]|jgi:hypothetical protein|uniref:STN domain-containing protein n=1 Tax=Tardiphaga sp. OK246 TaxID=1855307 RepID=UPI000B768931|nr:STN domain-containing protein [Tardiphaga sp. OK246]SNT64486.1 hypothetical protein SAMN05216374_0395 [Tardiphaga sp. OK246]